MQELKPQQTEEVTGARRIRFPITTLMVGEEGGRPPITTLAVGEEGGGGMTTMMVGEEDPVMTTMALGEEGNPPNPTSQTSTSALGSF